MSLRKQCDLLGLNRAGLYYRRRPESVYNLELMRLIDEEFTRHPEKGVPSMTAWLRDDADKPCNPKRVRRLMRQMGLEPVYPKPNTSRPNKQHRIYPYLLKDLTVDRPDQVWCSDITYIRLRRGFCYLSVVMDWYSRAVLSWRLSNTLDSDFCVEALREALDKYPAPEIFNSDQGAQYTSGDFIGVLKERRINISMDGRGRALDNIFVERLWRTVKYQNIYIRGYETLPEVQAGLTAYFPYYNRHRHHQSLKYRKPWDIYTGTARIAA